MNMHSKVLRVIHSMYKVVESIVQCGVSQSDVINQLVGLRQGCILSPCLFSAYISDLPKFLASREGVDKCEGVLLHDHIVHVLMYADDLALVATSAADLQRMLNALHVYASRWQLLVNVSKTKVMIFNRTYTTRLGSAKQQLAIQQRSVLNKSHSFIYNGNHVDIVSQFKYLGTIFHEDVLCTSMKVNSIAQCKLYDAAIQFRVSQGRKCLATWLRRCKTWMLNTDLVLTLFKTGAMPALEYGAGLWGVSSVRADAWQEVLSRKVLAVCS